jgi:hypothetical protein
MRCRFFEGQALLANAIARWQDRASSFAPKPPAEQITVSADPHVDSLRDPDHSWNPKKKANGHEKGHAQAKKTKATRAPINAARGRHTVNRFEQVFSCQ